MSLNKNIETFFLDDFAMTMDLEVTAETNRTVPSFGEPVIMLRTPFGKIDVTDVFLKHPMLFSQITMAVFGQIRSEEE